MTAITLDEKRALVAQRLPNVLGLGSMFGGGKKKCWYWLTNMKPVTQHEWLSIMHEAEKTLTDKQWPDYTDCLRITVGGGNAAPDHRWWKTYHASAEQRMDAFCHVVGKERGGEP